MKKSWWLFLLVLAGACTTNKTEDVTSLPDYPIEAGVSAPFAGFVEDWLIVAGGCNFPDVPAAKGGQKVYYREVYALNTAHPLTGWIRLPDLPFPVAYGAMAETDEGLLCMGGMNADSVTTSVFRIEKVNDTDSFMVRMLPAMPEPIDNGAAAQCGNRIYVTGGNQQGKAKSLYALQLKSGQLPVWEKLADYPGQQRIQPVLLTQDSMLYLCGGFESVRSDSCALARDVLRYDIPKNQWTRETELPDDESGKPRCLVGASGQVHEGNLLFAGGVNYQIFKDAMEGHAPKDYMEKAPEWYRFNKKLFAYDPVRKSWTFMTESEHMARAGGILLKKKGRLYMVCGETKPGVRTQKVVSVPIPSVGQ